MPCRSVGYDALDLVPECVVVLSDNLSIQHANSRFQRLMAPLGKCCALPFVESFVGKADQARLILLLQRASESSQPEGARVCHDVDTLLLGAADSLPIYRRFDWAAAWSDAPDALGGSVLVLSGRMVTIVDDRKKEAERELVDFFDCAPIALHWLSATGHVLWANKREMEVLGYTAEEYIGKPIMNFCPDDEELVFEIFKQLGSGNTIRDVPVRLRAKDGKIRDLLVDSNVNYHPDGTFNHTRCFIRDDTERKVREARSAAMLEAAKEMGKSKDLFVRKIFHEIRTPCHILAAALGDLRQSLSNACVRGSVDPADDFEMLEHAEVQAQRLRSIVSDALDAIMFDSGRVMSLFPAPFSPSELAADLLAAVEREASDGTGGKVKLVADVDVSSPFLLGDRDLIYRALHHLLSNAVKATTEAHLLKAQGEVRLSIRPQQDDHIRFAVRDQGPGIPEAEVQRVFQRYWQQGADLQAREDEGCEWTPLPAGGGDREHRSSRQTSECSASSGSVSGSACTSLAQLSLSSGCEGLGLGLNVSFHVVECMGGELSVSSEPGNTVFSFALALPEISASEAADPRLRHHERLQKNAEETPVEMSTWDSQPSRTLTAEDGSCARWAGAKKGEGDAAWALGTAPQPPLKAAETEAAVFSPERVVQSAGAGALIRRERRQGQQPKAANERQEQLAVEQPSGPKKVLRPWKLLHTTSLSDFITPEPSPSRSLEEVPEPLPPAVRSVEVNGSGGSAGSGGGGVGGVGGGGGGSGSGSGMTLAAQAMLNTSPNPKYECGVGLAETRAPHILLVEDNTICQKVAKRALETLGCTVDVRSDGQQCVDTLRAYADIFDLVLMDLRMPVLSGIDATHAIRGELGLHSLPIVAFSAEVGENVQAQCCAAGMQGFLGKPASREQMRAQIKQLLPHLPLKGAIGGAAAR